MQNHLPLSISAPINKKTPKHKQRNPQKDDGYIRDLDWTHVLATMDVWGKRGITCVNAEGDILPNSTSLNMISIINPTDACNIQAQPKMKTNRTHTLGN